VETRVRTPLGLPAKAWLEPLSDLTRKPKTAVVEPVSRAPLHADQVVAVGDLRVGDLVSVLLAIGVPVRMSPVLTAPPS
jgi:hypothetical protein